LLPTKNLKLWLPMEGNANDASGQGNDGTVEGASLTTGKFGQCYSFDGSDDYIDIPSISFGSTYTILAWVKPTATSNSVPQLMGKEYMISIKASEGEGYRFATGNGSQWDPEGWVTANTSLVADTWQFIAIRVDGTVLDFFYNGRTDGSDTKTSRSISTSFHIGAREDVAIIDYQYKGLIDSPMIFSKALSQSDIKRVMLGLHPLNG
jgi:hypothetical protein